MPIVQGGTFSFLVPTIAILSLPANKCPAEFTDKIINETIGVTIKESNTWSSSSYTEDEITEEWQRRMREVQGAIIVASIFQVIIGKIKNFFLK